MESWKRKRRQEYLERKEFRYYIFCEGEQTEPQYFSSFKKYIESNPIYKNLVLIEIEPCGAETMRVISQAEEFVRKNKVKKGQIWCLYDKDSFPAERFTPAMIAPGTKVYELVEELAKYLPEDIKVKFL